MPRIRRTSTPPAQNSRHLRPFGRRHPLEEPSAPPTREPMPLRAPNVGHQRPEGHRRPRTRSDLRHRQPPKRPVVPVLDAARFERRALRPLYSPDPRDPKTPGFGFIEGFRRHPPRACRHLEPRRTRDSITQRAIGVSNPAGPRPPQIPKDRSDWSPRTFDPAHPAGQGASSPEGPLTPRASKNCGPNSVPILSTPKDESKRRSGLSSLPQPANRSRSQAALRPGKLHHQPPTDRW
jgi:hypothetical protein